MNLSIKYRIFIYFIFISLIASLSILISINHFRSISKIEKNVTWVSRLTNCYVADYKFRSIFLQDDIYEADFYKNGITSNLEKRELNIEQTHKIVANLIASSLSEKLNIVNELNDYIKSLYINYLLTNQVIRLQKKRGFKDWGIEGVMRKHIHLLERYSQINKVTILTLRRHEKDYIIRNDNQYINKLTQLYQTTLYEIKEVKINAPDSFKSDAYLLKNYYSSFMQLVKYDKLIGKYTNGGILEVIKQSDNNITLHQSQLLSKIEEEKQLLISEMWQKFIIVLLIIVVANILISIYLSNAITKPLIYLSQKINKFIHDKFAIVQELDIKKRNDEIGTLIDNFKLLQSEIFEQIHLFNQKVDERTFEVRRQAMMIKLQNQEIMSQRDHLAEKNQIIEIQTKNMLDSIKYARRILEAVLPSDDLIERIIPRFFSIYKPKDIVSGDFFWVNEISNQKTDVSIVALADCTGHGVPGAFMSLIGQTALNQIVNGYRVTHPDNILLQLNTLLYETLHKKHINTIKDGMDIGILVFNRKTKIMEFSGAFMSAYLLRNNEIVEIKGDKVIMGSSRSILFNQTFTRNQIKVENGDIFYMVTDGYYDQFGGAHDKKMKRTQLIEYLESISDYPFVSHKDFLLKHFDNWQRNFEQTDDVTFVGLQPLVKENKSETYTLSREAFSKIVNN